MRTLKRSECAILHLVLKRKWYDMIASGAKREEYREDKPYWTKRIFRWELNFCTIGVSGVVEFAMGYQKNRPKMAFLATIPLFWKRVTPSHPEWGEPGMPHYVIGLDERVILED